MRVQKSIEIAAPPEKIWPFLVKPDKIMAWFTLLKKFEYTGKQRSGVGTPFYYEEKSGGRLMKFNYTVTEWVENSRLAFIMTSGPLKKDYQEWVIEAASSGSRNQRRPSKSRPTSRSAARCGASAGSGGRASRARASAR